MTTINNETINEIRNKIDIVDVVSKYVPLVKKGNNYFGVCPFHDDHSPSMSVSSSKQMYKCFSCGAAGNIFTFISNYEHLSFVEAVKILGESIGYTFSGTYKPKEEKYKKYYDIYDLANKFYQNNINTSLGKEALSYLEKRHIDKETIKKFNIGLSIQNTSLTNFLLSKGHNLADLVSLGISNNDSNDLFMNRIMFPLHDLNGNVIAFSGRVYNTKDQSKYINSKETPIFKKGNILYNYHNAKELLKKNDYVIVMEGFMDVIRASAVGINNCVATMGTALTKEQISLIKKMSDNVILCFDGDTAGETATITAVSMFEAIGINPKIIRLDKEKDPDEYIIKNGKDAFLNKIENAISLVEFRMQILKKDKNLSNIEDIAEYVELSIKELIKEDNDLVVELNLKKLGTEFNLNYDNLYDKYKKYKKDNKVKPKVVITKEKKKMDKCEIAERSLIFYMFKSEEVVNMVKNKISFMPHDNLRYLANEIIYYGEKYGEVTMADFVSYISGNEELTNTLNEIIISDYNEVYKNEEIEDYINIINNYLIMAKIKKLESDLKKEDDPLKQAEILKKIIDIKGVKV